MVREFFLNPPIRPQLMGASPHHVGGSPGPYADRVCTLKFMVESSNGTNRPQAINDDGTNTAKSML